jgi:hypothetical protein
MHATPEDVCVGLLDRLRTELDSPAFLQRYRQRPRDFTRQRQLTFKVAVLFLLNLVKRSVQAELDAFFGVLEGQEDAVRRVSASAWTHARKKLKYEAFVALNQVQVDYFYTHAAPQRWHGLRLLALDGSTARLPLTDAVCEHFGVWHPAAGGVCAKARLSQLFDVLNRVTVAALLLPKTVGERAAAARHGEHLQEGDLVLLDRGYPAFWLFALLLSKGAQLCARMPLRGWRVVEAFLASGAREQLVTLEPSATSRRQCEKLGVACAPLTVRLLRLDLDNGEGVVLLTSLLDAERYPHALFADLYAQRWPVEEDYKTLKSRLEIENWTGTSVLALYQDFHARVFTKNLAALLARPAQQQVDQQTATRRYRYHLNCTYVLSQVKDTVVRWLSTPARLLQRLQRFWDLIVHVIEPVRPDRSVPRKKRVKPRRYSMAYKAAC